MLRLGEEPLVLGMFAAMSPFVRHVSQTLTKPVTGRIALG